MALSGKTKTDYMREYMRRRRAAKKAQSNDAKPSDATATLKARIRELEGELARERAKANAPSDADEVAALKEQPKKANEAVRKEQEIYDHAMRYVEPKIMAPKWFYNIVRKRLHPDSAVGLTSKEDIEALRRELDKASQFLLDKNRRGERTFRFYEIQSEKGRFGDTIWTTNEQREQHEKGKQAREARSRRSKEAWARRKAAATRKE